MFDKEDDIEILSTKSQNTCNRTESRNVDDWYVICVQIKLVYLKEL